RRRGSLAEEGGAGERNSATRDGDGAVGSCRRRLTCLLHPRKAVTSDSHCGCRPPFLAPALDDAGTMQSTQWGPNPPPPPPPPPPILASDMPQATV
ncbi:hypothetical protein B296_00045785, partial [Ensete ventricosum]